MNEEIKTAQDAQDASGGAGAPEGNTAAQSNNNNNSAKGANRGVYTHTFKKPYEFENNRYVTITFNFERLTGKDMISVENEMQANSEYAIDPLLSKSFQSKMASRAGSIGNDALENMPLTEFSKITNAARNFLLESGY